MKRRAKTQFYATLEIALRKNLETLNNDPYFASGAAWSIIFG